MMPFNIDSMLMSLATGDVESGHLVPIRGPAGPPVGGEAGSPYSTWMANLLSLSDLTTFPHNLSLTHSLSPVSLVSYMSQIIPIQQPAPPRQRRYKTSLACTTCRRRKLKCDGRRPGMSMAMR